MKVLMLSTDMMILDAGSAVAARMRSYGSLFEHLTILVLGAGERQVLELSDTVHVVFPGGRSRREAFKNALWEGMREGRSLPADVVSVQDPFFVGFVGWRIAHALKAAFQVQAHTDFMSRAYAFSSARKCFEVLLSLFVLSRASCVRVVSPRVARSIRFIKKRNVFVLPIRVAPSPVEEPERPREYKDAPVILMVSRLESEKRVHLGVESMPHVPEAHLYIVGDGSLQASLEARARKLDVLERVHFLGWKEDVRPYYMHADLFLQLSRFEGYGIALIEAGLAGLGIVSTDVGVVGDIYTDNESVMVVPGSIQEISRAVHRLLADVTLRKRLGARAREAALEEVSEEDVYLNSFKATFEACAN